MRARHLLRYVNAVLSGADRLLPTARLWARPLRMHLAINDFCNLRCPHCLREAPSIKVNQNRLTVGDLKLLAPWFRSASFVALAGLGEPFLQNDLFEMIELVQAHGATPSIITNATLLDEAACRRLVGPRGLLVNLSIDAGTPEIFEKVRLGARFSQVVENIDRLVALRRQSGHPFPVLSINMTLLRDTLTEIPAVVELARRWDIHHIVAQTVCFVPGQDTRGQEVSNREAQAALAQAAACAARAGVEIRYVPLASDYETLVRDEQQPQAYPPSYPYHTVPKSVSGGTQRFSCPNLWHQFFVDVFGNMTYCCMADFGILGNIRQSPPEQLWNHPDMVALRKRLLEGNPPPECRRCYALEQWGRGKMWQAWKAEFGPLKLMP
ncbi:MAG TPA: radical SAM/SPASM domain-containing protein [Candidatus Sumerlaeota bacterium]|nr:radical SAM/SPASM domain-containing protein [Candidatus Sumerlaeota bacterium]HPS01887.1 radical SAM/SPASM domain-containing protein [Candidatus Sumerlaeota bacterium]